MLVEGFRLGLRVWGAALQGSNGVRAIGCTPIPLGIISIFAVVEPQVFINQLLYCRVPNRTT